VVELSVGGLRGPTRHLRIEAEVGEIDEVRDPERVVRVAAVSDGKEVVVDKEVEINEGREARRTAEQTAMQREAGKTHIHGKELAS
jgi:hypothetical protein